MAVMVVTGSVNQCGCKFARLVSCVLGVCNDTLFLLFWWWTWMGFGKWSLPLVLLGIWDLSLDDCTLDWTGVYWIWCVLSVSMLIVEEEQLRMLKLAMEA